MIVLVACSWCDIRSRHIVERWQRCSVASVQARRRGRSGPAERRATAAGGASTEQRRSLDPGRDARSPRLDRGQG